MPKKRPARLLGPLKSPLRAVVADVASLERARKLIVDSRALAERLQATTFRKALPTADQITPDDPYSRAFGYDRARQLLDPELEPRRALAAERRAKVLEMTVAGKRAREIGAAVGLRPGYVAKVRARLKAEGKL